MSLETKGSLHGVVDPVENTARIKMLFRTKRKISKSLLNFEQHASQWRSPNWIIIARTCHQNFQFADQHLANLLKFMASLTLGTIVSQWFALRIFACERTCLHDISWYSFEIFLPETWDHISIETTCAQAHVLVTLIHFSKVLHVVS